MSVHTPLPSQDISLRKTLTYREITEFYGIPYSTVKKLGAAGTNFTTYRIGPNNGRVFVDRKSFEAYLQRNAVEVRQ